VVDVYGVADYEKIKQAVKDALESAIEVSVHLASGDKPGRSWRLTSNDKPSISGVVTIASGVKLDRTWRLTSQERQPYVGGVPVDPRNIRQLVSADKPSRSWNLAKTADEVYGVLRTDAGAAYDARDRNWVLSSQERQPYVGGVPIDPRNIRYLTSGDTPAGFVREPGGTIIDPRNIRWLTSGDTPNVARRFGAGNLVSQQVVAANGIIGPLTVNAEKFSVYFKNHSKYASMSIEHQIRAHANAPWVELATDNAYKDLVTTISHVVYQYQAINRATTSLELTVDYRLLK
jgi:hypothetical protein